MSDEPSSRIRLEGRVEVLERFVERAGRVLPALDAGWAKQLPLVRDDALALIADAERLAALEEKVAPVFPEVVQAATRARGHLRNRLEALATRECLIANPWPVLLRALIDRTERPSTADVVLLEGPRPGNTWLPTFLAVGGLTFCVVHGWALIPWAVGLVAGAVWLGRRHVAVPAFRFGRERLLPGTRGPSFLLREATWRREADGVLLHSGAQYLRTPRGWAGTNATEALLRVADLGRLSRALPLRSFDALTAEGPGGDGLLALGRNSVTFISLGAASTVRRSMFGDGHDEVTPQVLVLAVAMLDDETYDALHTPWPGSVLGLTRVAWKDVTFGYVGAERWKITAGSIEAVVDRLGFASIDRS